MAQNVQLDIFFIGSTSTKGLEIGIDIKIKHFLSSYILDYDYDLIGLTHLSHVLFLFF